MISRVDREVLTLGDSASGDLTRAQGGELQVPAGEEWYIKLKLFGRALGNSAAQIIEWDGRVIAYRSAAGALNVSQSAGGALSAQIVSGTTLRLSVNSSAISNVNCNWTAVAEIVSAAG